MTRRDSIKMLLAAPFVAMAGKFVKKQSKWVENPDWITASHKIEFKRTQSNWTVVRAGYPNEYLSSLGDAVDGWKLDPHPLRFEFKRDA